MLLFLSVIAVAAANAPYKGYSGIRLKPDSLLMVYYYEQAFAVVELGKKRQLFNCEIIEAYETPVQKELLSNLTSIGKVYKIGFKSMLDLMNRCDELPASGPNRQSTAAHHSVTVTGSLLSGVLPGTRWCGNGDIASSYFDLGPEKSDKCCRKHDLCPIKVRNSSSKYGIVNSGFSMSHCDCDYEFQKCLRKTNSSAGTAMEYFYFEVLQSQCLDGSLTKGFKTKRSSAYALAKGK